MQRRLRSQIVLLTATVALCLSIAACKPAPVMNETEKNTMNELTQEMQTHCVGRYLIDLPKDFEVGTRQAVGYKREVVIETLGKMTESGFNTYMQQIEAEYKVKKNRRQKISYFFSTSKPTTDSQIFERIKDDEEPIDSRLIEGYKWSNGIALKMVVAATESSLENREDAASTIKTGLDVSQRKKYITGLLARLRSRETTEIPKEPGFCFDGGFLSGKAGEGKELEIDEEFGAGGVFKTHPDVSFTFNSYTAFREKTTLLERQLNKLVENKHGRLLRQGAVKLAGVPQAEEFLMEGEQDYFELVDGKRVRGHYFTMQGNSKIGSPQTPLFNLTMETANIVSKTENSPNLTKGPSLSDAQATALWDAISRTIRLR